MQIFTQALIHVLVKLIFISNKAPWLLGWYPSNLEEFAE